MAVKRVSVLHRFSFVFLFELHFLYRKAHKSWVAGEMKFTFLLLYIPINPKHRTTPLLKWCWWHICQIPELPADSVALCVPVCACLHMRVCAPVPPCMGGHAWACACVYVPVPPRAHLLPSLLTDPIPAVSCSMAALVGPQDLSFRRLARRFDSVITKSLATLTCSLAVFCVKCFSALLSTRDTWTSLAIYA